MKVVSLWFERWFLSSNAKDIGTLYLIFALFSGLIGTAFSILIRLELSGPGVQYISDNQLYNSIITAHAIVMIFFMVNNFMFNITNIPLLFMSTSNNNEKNDIEISNKNIDNNNNNDNNNNKYIKVVIVDPINNRDQILKIAKGELNPHWVTGFIDAEGCFGFRIRKNIKLNIGWEIIPYFSLSVHIKDLPILYKLKEFFQVGNISESKNMAMYQVSSVKDIIGVIIPHFLKYPLITQKQADFKLFNLAIDLIAKKEHKNIEGLNKFVQIKASINNGLNEVLQKSFPDIIPIERPIIGLPEFINPYWFAGFVSGDGCFSVEILKSSTYKLGYQVILRFTITQHIRDVELLKCFINYIEGGFVKEKSDISEFTLVKLSIIKDKLIPLFNKYPIYGVKNENFKDFCQIADLLENKAHLTLDGLEKIREIKNGMNKSRK